MEKIRLLLVIAGFSCLMMSCSKDENSPKTQGKIEFYMIQSFDTAENSFRIDEATVICDNTPLIEYSEIILYDSASHVFKITNEAKTSIDNLNHSVHGLAFAVMADHELIYTGYFFPSYSSMPCDWVVIDPILVGMDTSIMVELGYPGLLNSMDLSDKRNDPRIISILKEDNKLVD